MSVRAVVRCTLAALAVVAASCYDAPANLQIADALRVQTLMVRSFPGYSSTWSPLMRNVQRRYLSKEANRQSVLVEKERQSVLDEKDRLRGLYEAVEWKAETCSRWRETMAERLWRKRVLGELKRDVFGMGQFAVEGGSTSIVADSVQVDWENRVVKMTVMTPSFRHGKIYVTFYLPQDYPFKAPAVEVRYNSETDDLFDLFDVAALTTGSGKWDSNISMQTIVNLIVKEVEEEVYWQAADWKNNIDADLELLSDLETLD